MRLYGKDWAKIAEHVATKTRTQIGSHSQKFRKDLYRNPDHPEIDLLLILEGELVKRSI